MLLGDLFAISVFPNLVRLEVALIHFHILFLLPKYDSDTACEISVLQDTLFREVLAEWKRNVAPPIWSKKRSKFIPDSRHPQFKPLCTYVRKYVRGQIRTNFDLHYVEPSSSLRGSADVCFYVMKYMLKPSNRAIRLQQALHMNLPEDEYEDIWSMVHPRHFESEGLGLGVSSIDSPQENSAYHKVLEHLRKGVELSKKMTNCDDPTPKFFNPFTGASAPLAKYYKSNPNIFSMDDYLDFFYAAKRARVDNVILPDDDLSHTQLDKRIDDFEKNAEYVLRQQTSQELDELFPSILSDDFIDF